MCEIFSVILLYMYSVDIINYYRQYILEHVGDDNLPVLEDILDIFFYGNDFITLDQLAYYLGSQKTHLKKTLIRSYQIDRDYYVENKNKNNYGDLIYLTMDCAKRMCLRSNTTSGERVRDYFVLAEELYKDYMLRSIKHKRNRNTDEKIGGSITNYPIGNCVYVIKIKYNRKFIYKIGSTDNLNRRYKEHSYTIPGFVGVVYYELFERNTFLEVCIQDYLHDKQLSIESLSGKNLVEIYETDLNNIKTLFKLCKDIRNKIKFVQQPLSNTDTPVIFE